jgi:hypothetical protein
MADLEEHAIKRDRGFLVRLALLLLVGLIAGLMIYKVLVGETVAGCAATTFGAVDEQPGR